MKGQIERMMESRLNKNMEEINKKLEGRKDLSEGRKKSSMRVTPASRAVVKPAGTPGASTIDANTTPNLESAADPSALGYAVEPDA